MSARVKLWGQKDLSSSPALPFTNRTTLVELMNIMVEGNLCTFLWKASMYFWFKFSLEFSVERIKTKFSNCKRLASILLDFLYYLLSLHALMKHAVMLESPMWQRTKGGLQPTASEDPNPANIM